MRTCGHPQLDGGLKLGKLRGYASRPAQQSWPSLPSSTPASVPVGVQVDSCREAGLGAHHRKRGYRGPRMAGVVRFAGMPMSEKPAGGAARSGS